MRCELSEGAWPSSGIWSTVREQPRDVSGAEWRSTGREEERTE